MPNLYHKYLDTPARRSFLATLLFVPVLIGCGGGGGGNSSSGGNNNANSPTINYVKPNHLDHYVYKMTTLSGAAFYNHYPLQLEYYVAQPSGVVSSIGYLDVGYKVYSEEGKSSKSTYRVNCDLSPPQSWEEYPLFIGKTWDFKFLKSCRLGSSTLANTVSVKGKVISAEKITVSAGTFDTLKEEVVALYSDLQSGAYSEVKKTCWVDVLSGMMVKCDGKRNKSSFYSMVNASDVYGNGKDVDNPITLELIGYKNKWGSKIVDERYGKLEDYYLKFLENGVTASCSLFFTKQGTGFDANFGYGGCTRIPKMTINENGTITSTDVSNIRYRKLTGNMEGIFLGRGTMQDSTTGRTVNWILQRADYDYFFMGN